MKSWPTSDESLMAHRRCGTFARGAGFRVSSPSGLADLCESKAQAAMDVSRPPTTAASLYPYLCGDARDDPAAAGGLTSGQAVRWTVDCRIRTNTAA